MAIWTANRYNKGFWSFLPESTSNITFKWLFVKHHFISLFPRSRTCDGFLLSFTLAFKTPFQALAPPCPPDLFSATAGQSPPMLCTPQSPAVLVPLLVPDSHWSLPLCPAKSCSPFQAQSILPTPWWTCLCQRLQPHGSWFLKSMAF